MKRQHRLSSSRGASPVEQLPRTAAAPGRHRRASLLLRVLLLFVLAVGLGMGSVQWRISRNNANLSLLKSNAVTVNTAPLSYSLSLAKKEVSAPPMQQRVIVVGGGLAGQTAAIIAAQNGAHVTILEKEGRMGGNSAKATSGINGWGTPAQAAKGVLDGPAHFENDTFNSGSGGDYRSSLVHMLSRRSTDAINWLSSFGVPLSVLSQLGGHSRPRTHRAPDKPEGTPLPIGFTTVSTLEKHIRSELAGQVDIRTQARLRSLVHEHTVLPSGDCVTVVKGVEFEQPEAEKEQPAVQRLHADAVILATGGFSNDRTESSLLMEYAPHLTSFPTTNGPWATGDGVKIARELDVALVDMDKVQLHPTGLLNPKDPQGKTVFLGPEALRGSGGILLNKQGERFVNELDLRSVVSQAIIAQNNEFPGSGGRKFAYCVLNAAAAEAFGPAALGFYWKKLGLVRYAEDVAALAAVVGADAAVVQKTLEDYQTLSSTKEKCPQTGKRIYPCVLGPEGPYYVAYVTPSIHYTMGGCLISPAAEIQSAQSTAFGDPLPILGLFGAGEVTGGVHGKNRLGGNSLLECVVFGKIAGERAARATTIEPRTTFSAGSMAELPSTVLEYTGSAGGPRTVDLATTGGQLFLSLPNAAHISGLGLLQRVVVRHDGKERAVVPATSPSHLGRLGIVLPPRSEAPPEDAWLYDLTPGATVSLAAGPAVSGHVSTLAKELVVVVDGLHGHAVMHHLLRASLAEERQRWTSVRVLYVASGLHDARHAQELCARHQKATNGAAPRLSCTVLLTKAAPDWEGEVGQLDMDHVRVQLPAAQPAEDTLLVLSGRPNVLQVLAQELQAMEFQDEVNLLLLPP